MSAIRITVPMALGPSQLVSTNVPENEHAAWSAGATYALGDRVIRASAIYESAQAGNIGHDPIDAGDAWWLYVNPTNRWAAFSLLRPTPMRRAEAPVRSSTAATMPTTPPVRRNQSHPAPASSPPAHGARARRQTGAPSTKSMSVRP